jgi:hypothetical protein
MSGLDEEQLSELECRVSELLQEPWNKEEGRPRELTLQEALIVTCGYMRQNIIEDVWADIFDVAHARPRFHPARSVFDTRCRRVG